MLTGTLVGWDKRQYWRWYKMNSKCLSKVSLILQEGLYILIFMIYFPVLNCWLITPVLKITVLTNNVWWGVEMSFAGFQWPVNDCSGYRHMVLGQNTKFCAINKISYISYPSEFLLSCSSSHDTECIVIFSS